MWQFLILYLITHKIAFEQVQPLTTQRSILRRSFILIRAFTRETWCKKKTGVDILGRASWAPIQHTTLSTGVHYACVQIPIRMIMRYVNWLSVRLSVFSTDGIARLVYVWNNDAKRKKKRNINILERSKKREKNTRV